MKLGDWFCRRGQRGKTWSCPTGFTGLLVLWKAWLPVSQGLLQWRNELSGWVRLTVGDQCDSLEISSKKQKKRRPQQVLTTELEVRLGGAWGSGQRGENLQLAFLLTLASQKEDIKEDVKESLKGIYGNTQWGKLEMKYLGNWTR